MKVVVVGATGNVGTSVVAALGRDERVHDIVGIARRMPQWQPPKTRWVSADITRDDLVGHFQGADAVIHLAWLIQPSRDGEQLRSVNVDGSRRVFEAAARAGAGALVYASSIGVYSPGPKDRPVDESWPRDGIPSLFYSRHKAETERMLDQFEDRLRVVRLRPGLIFKAQAGPEIRRLFAGPFLPTRVLGHVPIVPLPARLAVQCVHTDDIAEAYRLAALSLDAHGAYNVAADPPLAPADIARLLGGRHVPVPEKPIRVLADLAFRAHLAPTPPGWYDLGLAVPLMDTTRAREQLGWTPTYSSEAAMLELFDGMKQPAGAPTPPLEPHAGGRARVQEVLTGLGSRL
jgi:UDP-glucose 4-epimerase